MEFRVQRVVDAHGSAAGQTGRPAERHSRKQGRAPGAERDREHPHSKHAARVSAYKKAKIEKPGCHRSINARVHAWPRSKRVVDAGEYRGAFAAVADIDVADDE